MNIDHTDPDPFLYDKNETNQPMTSSPISSITDDVINNEKSPIVRHKDSDTDLNKSASSNGQSKSRMGAKTKDDIILRTLLKTSDMEPQLLNLESVFEMNPSKKGETAVGKKDELLGEMQNQQSPSFKPLARGDENKKSMKKQEPEQNRKRKKTTKSVLNKGNFRNFFIKMLEVPGIYEKSFFERIFLDLLFNFCAI